MSDFDVPIAMGKVTIRGRTVPLRAVSAMESARVREAFPRPMAPMTSFTRKGSVATPLPYPMPDDADEAYRRKHLEWLALCSAGDVAIGLDWVTKDGKPALEAPVEAVQELRRLFSDNEIGAWAQKQDTLTAGAEEAALKNSSAPAWADPMGATFSGCTKEVASSSSATGSPGSSC